MATISPESLSCSAWARQRDHVVPDDPNADVVKVVVAEVGDVPLGLGQRMAFVAAAMGVEKLPAAFGRIVNGVLVTSDEMIERRIKRNLSTLIGCYGAHQIGAVGWVAENAPEGLLIAVDPCDPGHGALQAVLAHFHRIDDRERRLILESLHPAVPELRLVVEGV